jgi:aspartyl-tRNA(Asn)/glutamyl-tRNA(Gln) amidotransferase subunit A
MDSDPRRYAADLERGARGLRIGFVRHFHETDMVADLEVSAAVEDVARVLQREGAVVSDVTLPSLQQMQAVTSTIWLAEAWRIHAQWLRERPEDYTAASRRKLLAGAFLSAEDYVRALQARTMMIDAVNAVFRDVDILLTASSFDTTCRIDDQTTYVRNYPRQARSPFSATGHPAIGMTCGMCKKGLPLSVQFVGRIHDEVTLLRAAAAYERATPWHKNKPPLDEKVRAPATQPR